MAISVAWWTTSVRSLEVALPFESSTIIIIVESGGNNADRETVGGVLKLMILNIGGSWRRASWLTEVDCSSCQTCDWIPCSILYIALNLEIEVIGIVCLDRYSFKFLDRVTTAADVIFIIIEWVGPGLAHFWDFGVVVWLYAAWAILVGVGRVEVIIIINLARVDTEEVHSTIAASAQAWREASWLGFGQDCFEWQLREWSWGDTNNEKHDWGNSLHLCNVARIEVKFYYFFRGVRCFNSTMLWHVSIFGNLYPSYKFKYNR